MAKLKPVDRPSRELVEPFRDFGTATISSGLREVCGIMRHFLVGPVAFTTGKKTVGTAVNTVTRCRTRIAGHAAGS